MILEHDCVILTEALPGTGLREGDVGTVVHIHGDGVAYELEFFALDGRTLDVVTVGGDQVRRIPFEAVGKARVVAALSRFADEVGPTFSEKQLLDWFRTRGSRASDVELLRSLRLLKERDEATGYRIKRFWKFRDPETGESHFRDFRSLAPEQRLRLLESYLDFVEQLRALRGQMAQMGMGTDAADRHKYLEQVRWTQRRLSQLRQRRREMTRYLSGQAS